MIKAYFQYLWDNAENHNKQNILFLLDHQQDAVLLDAGCDDGEWNLKLGEKVGTKN
jgi:hypothetical protein